MDAAIARTILIGVTCLLFNMAATAQPVTRHAARRMSRGHSGDATLQARLDQVVRSFVDEGAFMGSVLVSEGDKRLLDKGYGSADLEWNRPNDPNVRFHIGSLTKQFTAALILQLQDEGKLRVDNPVSRYLPDAPKNWDKITLADLMGHRSGIPNFIGDPAFHAWSMSAHTAEEELALFRDTPLEFAPGTRFSYSNSNFTVLGIILEKITGKSYGELLRERILAPLGMNDSGLDSDDLVLPRRAQGYVPANGGFARLRPESMTVAWAVGGMYSTTADLLRWEHGLFGGKVISASALKAMITPGLGGYGLGVFVHSEQGLTFVDHGGSIEGFNAHLTYIPERKIGIVVLGNVDAFVPDTIAAQLANVMLGKPVTLPLKRQSAAIAKQELARFVGVYEVPAIGPGFTLTVSMAGDSLSAQLTGREPTTLEYQGVKNGHPRFYAPREFAEFEFIPNASGSITSFVLHVGGENIRGMRR
ncbi:MAG TPA: serine hydrolase [Sphingomicrobium sp.]|nr:serine hydrolase [Sphingomicrobium sp.]